MYVPSTSLDKANAAAGTPDDEATRLLAAAHAAYKTTDAIRDRVRNSSDSEANLDGITQVNAAVSGLNDIDDLLAAMNDDSDAASALKPKFIAAVDATHKAVGKAEAALARRASTRKSDARVLLGRVAKRLERLEARNHVTGDPDDEVTHNVEKVRATMGSLEEMLKLGIVGGDDDTGASEGGIMQAVDELAEAIEGTVEGVASREFTALDDVSRVTNHAM